MFITMFGGYLMKIYAWKTISGNQGVINSGHRIVGPSSIPNRLPSDLGDLELGGSSGFELSAQPIGTGVPLARKPTTPEPIMPLPYWIASSTPDAAPL